MGMTYCPPKNAAVFVAVEAVAFPAVVTLVVMGRESGDIFESIAVIVRELTRVARDCWIGE